MLRLAFPQLVLCMVVPLTDTDLSSECVFTRLLWCIQAGANAAEKKNEELIGALHSKLTTLKSVSSPDASFATCGSN